MDKPARQIDVLIYNGVNLLDVSGPVQAFTECCVNGQRAYQLLRPAPGYRLSALT